MSRLAEFGCVVWGNLDVSYGGIWMSRKAEFGCLVWQKAPHFSGLHFQQVSQETLESLLQHGGRVSKKGIGFFTPS